LPLEEGAVWHGYAGCGWHYKNFDHYKGAIDFAAAINEYLNDYKEGYELNEKGEIYILSEPEFKPLLGASVPKNNFIVPIGIKIEAAKAKFGKYFSTIQDRQDAVRELADILELIKPKVKKVLSNKDDSDLYNIINNFGIRHYNNKQKNNYDKNIWLRWMFYFYLATIHAVLRMTKKEN